MTKSKFSKPPKILDQSAIEEKASNFIDRAGEGGWPRSTPKKVRTKALFLRIPEKLWLEIHALSEERGMSVNAVCSDILRKKIKHASIQQS